MKCILRTVPFGATFRSAQGLRAGKASQEDSLILFENELAVDVGSSRFGRLEESGEKETRQIYDHHFAGPNVLPSASATVLACAKSICDQFQSFDEVYVVTHEEPDFDALCATYLVYSLLDSEAASGSSLLDPGDLSRYAIGSTAWDAQKMLVGMDWLTGFSTVGSKSYDPENPAMWAILLAAYASRLDQGLRIDAPGGGMLHNIFYAFGESNDFRGYEEEVLKDFFPAIREAIVGKRLNPLQNALFDETSSFAPQIQKVRNWEALYHEDFERARKSIVRLPSVRGFLDDYYPLLRSTPFAVRAESGEFAIHSRHRELLDRLSGSLRKFDAIWIANPKCPRFKEFARQDVRNSTLKRGFVFTAVYDESEKIQYHFALDPEHAEDVVLYHLWANLQLEEMDRRRVLGKTDPEGTQLSDVREGFRGRLGNPHTVGYQLDPWYDGSGCGATLVASPFGGSVLPKEGKGKQGSEGVATPFEIAEKSLELAVFGAGIEFQTIAMTSEPRGGWGDTTLLTIEEVPSFEAPDEMLTIVSCCLDMEEGNEPADSRGLNHEAFAQQIAERLWPAVLSRGSIRANLEELSSSLQISPRRLMFWRGPCIVFAYTTDQLDFKDQEEVKRELSRVQAFGQKYAAFTRELDRVQKKIKSLKFQELQGLVDSLKDQYLELEREFGATPYFQSMPMVGQSRERLERLEREVNQKGPAIQGNKHTILMILTIVIGIFLAIFGSALPAYQNWKGVAFCLVFGSILVLYFAGRRR